MYGRSVANQRIEAWWSFLKQSCTSWWIDFFKDMRDQGIFSDHDPIHIDCMRFCFINTVQQELYRVAKHWNLHRIRPSSNVESSPGRPDVLLYFLPELNDTRNYMTEVSQDNSEVVEDVCCDRNQPTVCSNEFRELAETIMREQNLHMLANAEGARSLFIDLVSAIENFELAGN